MQAEKERRGEGRLAGVGHELWGEEGQRWKWPWKEYQVQHGGIEEEEHWGGGSLDPLGCKSQGSGREQKVPNGAPEAEEQPHRSLDVGMSVV